MTALAFDSERLHQQVQRLTPEVLQLPAVEQHYGDAVQNYFQFYGLDFERFYLQPKDPLGPDKSAAPRHTQAVIDYCLTHPQWRMSVQTHKLVGLK